MKLNEISSRTTMCGKNQFLVVLYMLTFIGFATSEKVVCNNDAGNFTANDMYARNRRAILSSLTSKVPDINGFYNATIGEYPNQVYALAYCRGDVSPMICSSCFESAVRNIGRTCPRQKEVIAWNGNPPCILRYANRSFFGKLELNPYDSGCSRDDLVSTLSQFNLLSRNLIVDVMRRASSGTSPKFATGEVNLTPSQTMYTLMQCSPDLSESDCYNCLNTTVDLFLWKFPGKKGGYLQTPSCIWRWDLFPFYATSLPISPTNNKRGADIRTVTAIVAPSIGFLIIVVTICTLLQRKKKSKQDVEENAPGKKDMLCDLPRRKFPNKDCHGERMGSSKEYLDFQLDIIKAATEHFSIANKLGEGGFGPVYKGTLADGRQIAVKRLSITSRQGLVEFKNEVMLIIRLQHKNLVTLLGCCLEDNETLLIYEFMPNRSLDVMLFDSSASVKLDWQQRLRILNGIARGIMYLHEDSRLKIIHRDLKASNVLLDAEMNPKISDFGMAMVFGQNQSEANTNRIVGTFGYMAPEYAMDGLFSVKSDVFSFGVLLLEIISGKKNKRFFLSDYGESLLTYAWKLWFDGQWMELVDPVVLQSCVASEVLKCIQIGLLCVQEDPADRPSMSSVVVMLAGDGENIILPRPSKPPFCSGRLEEQTLPFTDKVVWSINEVTHSCIMGR